MRRLTFGKGLLLAVIVSIAAFGIFAYIVASQLNTPNALETKKVGQNQTEKAAESSTTKGMESKEPIKSEGNGDPVIDAEKKIGTWISNTHNFYNETTGWGGINHLNEEEQINHAKKIIRYVKKNEESIEGSLQTDLVHAKSTAKSVVNVGKSKSKVRQLHRIFHDLDIAVNGYSDYAKVWGVTKTLGNGQ